MKRILVFAFCLIAFGLVAQVIYQPHRRNAFRKSAAGNSNTNSISAYWAMEDLTDSSGNGNTLTKNGSPSFISGKIGLCASDFTVSDYYSAADNVSFSALQNSLTIAGWTLLTNVTVTRHWVIKFNNVSGQNEWAAYFSTDSDHWAFNYLTNAFAASIVNAETNAISINTWYFVVMQVDATNLVNRIRYGDTAGTLYPWITSSTFAGYGPAGQGTNTTGTIKIGLRTALDLGYPGRVDELGIWSRLLTDAEITNIWNNGSGKTWPLTP